MGVKIRRLGALLIDYIIIFYVNYFLMISVETFVSENIYLHMLFTIMVMLLFFNLFLRKDILFGYESIGKKIMKLKIYDTDGKRVMNKKRLVDRVFHSFWYFPFYPLMILINNKSNGDKKLRTEVK